MSYVYKNIKDGRYYYPEDLFMTIEEYRDKRLKEIGI